MYGLDDPVEAATPPSLAKSVSKLVDGSPGTQILSEALTRCRALKQMVKAPYFLRSASLLADEAFWN